MIRLNKQVTLLILSSSLLSADWRDDIGLTELEAITGAPDGSGIVVLQAEADENRSATITEYTPHATGAGTGNFLGKTFSDVSASSDAVSGHATTVGNYFYGLSVGVAPGVSEIHAYEANDYLAAGFLQMPEFGGNGRVPSSSSEVIHNHSWIGNLQATEEGNGLERGSLGNDILHRLDYAIEQGNIVVCVGLNNGSGTSVPDLFAPAFNEIGVGRTNGGHSRGTTPSHLDVPGRLAVDIVAPTSVTSWATAVVSGAAALILDTTEGSNQEPELIKAVMLAGATKDEFASWSRTTASPLDSVFGAGELNVMNNHNIITAGEQESSATTEIPVTGWDYEGSITSGVPVPYYFSVPAGHYAVDVSWVLTWNRTITDSANGPSFIPESTTHDMSLKLSNSSNFVIGSTIDESDSAVDNLEHIYQPSLSTGEYVMEVSSDSSKDYAIAWRGEILPNPDVSITGGSVVEGAGDFDLVVSLASVSQADMTVNYSTSSGTATSGQDFSSVSGSLVIPAGQLTGTISVPILEDIVEDAGESFVVNLSNPINGTLTVTQATVTIIDNDPEPVVTFDSYVVDETGGNVSVDMNLSAISNVDVLISYSTSDATATAAQDYTNTNQTLTIPTGNLLGTIQIPITDDSAAEDNEVFNIVISSVQNASVGNSSATVTIIDDDFAEALSESPVSISRNATTGVYAVGWDSIAGRNYTVETSLGLSQWDPLTGFIGFEASSAQEVVDLGPFTDDRRFFRIIDVTNDGSPNP